ncbi:MAG: sulfotransferase [Rhodospirillales bacterium]|nr:sulfotransferase [Rhodospirillales bacterium]
MSVTTSLLQVVDDVAARFGLLNRPLDAAALLTDAQNRTGLSDFGNEPFLDPLRRFLEASTRESALTVVGRIATRWDVTRFLSNLLVLREAEARDPGIQHERIDRPIFITGLPRSGTTFLHRLMMHDPATRAPLVWQTIFPYPKASPARSAAQVQRQLRSFERLAPEFRALHPLDATSPQECSEITAHVFRSLRFDTNYDIPSYRAWLDADEGRQLPAFRFHKRFLQHLQHQSFVANGRWVLKCPEHVFALNAIREVYPDARIVFVHRDPVKVLLSVAKLTEVLRRPFSRAVDPLEIGRQESARWLDGTRRMMAAGDDIGLPEPICHVHYLDLVSDPLATVEGVYQHFGMTLPETASAGIQAYVAAKPNGGYGPRDYHFEDHGLSAEAETEKFRPYLLKFGITPEARPGQRRRTAAPRQTETVGRP